MMPTACDGRRDGDTSSTALVRRAAQLTSTARVFQTDEADQRLQRLRSGVRRRGE